MKHIMIGALAGSLFAACVAAPTGDTASPQVAAHALMSWTDLTSRPLPVPDRTFAYGAHPAQIADLWLPDGEGPHPVVLMIHGGCWQKAIADRTLMNHAAADLRARGLAVWNVEYRGVDEDGGGYPGTFLDVAAAADLLGETGEGLGLKTGRIVAYGHSAGGHLAAWLAARPNLPGSSPLHDPSPLSIQAVLNVGGLADLEASEPVTLQSCLGDISASLTGPASETRTDVFADTSPARLQPVPAIQVSINGLQDRIAPPELGLGYTRLVEAAGGTARYVGIDGTGHVELIAPGSEAFETEVRIIGELLGQ